jgi:hypothetical protein
VGAGAGGGGAGAGAGGRADSAGSALAEAAQQLGRARAWRVARRGAAMTEPGLSQSNQTGNIAHSPTDPLAAHWLHVSKMHPLALVVALPALPSASNNTPLDDPTIGIQNSPPHPTPFTLHSCAFSSCFIPHLKAAPEQAHLQNCIPHYCNRGRATKPASPLPCPKLAACATTHTSSTHPGNAPPSAPRRWALGYYAPPPQAVRWQQQLASSSQPAHDLRLLRNSRPGRRPPTPRWCAVLQRWGEGWQARWQGGCTSAAPRSWQGAASG